MLLFKVYHNVDNFRININGILMFLIFLILLFIGVIIFHKSKKK